MINILKKLYHIIKKYLLQIVNCVNIKIFLNNYNLFLKTIMYVVMKVIFLRNVSKLFKYNFN